MREYGITTSSADYWLHVCPKDASLYLYPRHKMLEIIHKFKMVEIPTAKGFLVPILKNLRQNSGIIRAYDFGYDWFKQWTWEAATDEAIGKMGEECVQLLSKKGDFMLPVLVVFYDEKIDQYKGKDFYCELPKPTVNIEIKTDLPGGRWGTGNLFVQTHEAQHKRGSK